MTKLITNFEVFSCSILPLAIFMIILLASKVLLAVHDAESAFSLGPVDVQSSAIPALELAAGSWAMFVERE